MPTPSFLYSRRVGYPAAILAVAATVALLRLVPRVAADSADLILLLAVFLTARLWESGPGALAALLATIALKYFFLPPLHTLRLTDPQDVVALVVFVTGASIVGRLTATSRQRLRQIEAERQEVVTVSRLSQSFLGDTNREALLAVAVDRLREALSCEALSVHLAAPDGELQEVAAMDPGEGGRRADLVQEAFRHGRVSVVPAPRGLRDLYLPVSIGVHRSGVLVARGLQASERMAEACAALLGLALERERFIGMAREAEVTRARDEMKSTLLATLAHDLKTPVAVARASVENWQADAGQSERSLAAGRSLAKLTRLIDELLNVIKLEAGVARPKQEPASCAEIVEVAVARVSDALEHHTLHVEAQPTALTVTADAAQIAEALSLGLENAARHSPRSVEVRVEVEDRAEEVVFRIEDGGPGIPAADRRRVMQKFVRLPTSEGVPGSGLGLYIARTLAEMNGGRLELGEAASGGTRFEIVLPKVAS